jgi:mannose-6-phosphate isomerase-like protein (cupin superfamily)
MHSSTQAKVRQGRAGDSPAVDLWGWALTYLHEPADDGDVLVFEARTRGGGIVPPHTEDNQESFYVLEGSFEIETDGEPHRLEVGDYLVMAPGVVHSLRNAGDGWGRVLITTSPGAGHRRFFELMGSPLAPGADPTPLTAPPAFAPILAAGRECGMEFVPPPAG